MSDILWQKKAGIERCIKQVRDYYAIPSEKYFTDDFYKQDAVVVNLQRACEQCIDMANHVIRLKKLGLPSESAESFTLLWKAGIIDAELEAKLKGMVGFRNITVHQYREIDYTLVEKVLKKDDLPPKSHYQGDLRRRLPCQGALLHLPCQGDLFR